MDHSTMHFTMLQVEVGPTKPCIALPLHILTCSLHLFMYLFYVFVRQMHTQFLSKNLKGSDQSHGPVNTVMNLGVHWVKVRWVWIC